MNPNARTAPPTRPTNKTKDAIIGLIALAVLTCIGVIAYPMLGTGGDQRGDTHSKSSREPRATTSMIAASIREFQMGIPLLEQEGLVRTQDPDGIEYRWKSRSNLSWIALSDYGANGTLERISAFLPMPNDDEATRLMSMGLAYRLAELASGRKLDAGEFSDWVVANISRSVTDDVVQEYGATPVRFMATQTDGVNGLTFLIGE